MRHEDDSRSGDQGRSTARREPGTILELGAAWAFLCLFIGGAISMSIEARSMGFSSGLDLMPLGMAAVAALMGVAMTFRFVQRRREAEVLAAQREERERVERLELQTKEAELRTRMQLAAEATAAAKEPVVCAYCGASRGAEELACGGCGAKRS